MIRRIDSHKVTVGRLYTFEHEHENPTQWAKTFAPRPGEPGWVPASARLAVLSDFLEYLPKGVVAREAEAPDAAQRFHRLFKLKDDPADAARSMASEIIKTLGAAIVYHVDPRLILPGGVASCWRVESNEQAGRLIVAYAGDEDDFVIRVDVTVSRRTS